MSINIQPQVLDMVGLEQQSVEVYQQLPKNLHQISAREKALLERSEEHYTAQRNANRIVIALLDGEIIGSVGRLSVSDKMSEVSGAWVKEQFRGHGIGSALHRKLGEVASKVGDTLYATVKPGIPGNFAEVVVNAKELKAYPISFNRLKIADVEAFRGCCGCDENHNHESCPSRDKECFLLMQGISKEDSLHFVNSEKWRYDTTGRQNEVLIPNIK